MALRLITAGESHGPGLTCIVEGLPAGMINVLLETEEERFDAAMIQTLYEAAEYPLPRTVRPLP